MSSPQVHDVAVDLVVVIVMMIVVHAVVMVALGLEARGRCLSTAAVE